MRKGKDPDPPQTNGSGSGKPKKTASTPNTGSIVELPLFVDILSTVAQTAPICGGRGGGGAGVYLRVDHVELGSQLTEYVHEAAVSAGGRHHQGRLALSLVRVDIFS
jgi:hypothetical protein